MKFDELDEKMRVFETAHDLCVLPGLYMVARLDGRSFTRLTKEVHQFEAPFDARFRDLMLDTAEHLMGCCGFNMVYGYTESDEISLLFGQEENGFGRKLRKLISILAGEASAKFSLLLGAMAAFDCRISQLPRPRPRRRLLPLAKRRRPPQCPERPLLLAAAQAGQGRRRSDGSASRAVRRREERVAVPERDQLQRSPVVAEAGRRALLGGVRPARREPGHRREGVRPEKANSPRP